MNAIRNGEGWANCPHNAGTYIHLINPLHGVNLYPNPRPHDLIHFNRTKERGGGALAPHPSPPPFLRFAVKTI